jgi:hypothetical protein
MRRPKMNPQEEGYPNAPAQPASIPDWTELPKQKQQELLATLAEMLLSHHRLLENSDDGEH